jgi:hypothetical protein
MGTRLQGTVVPRFPRLLATSDAGWPASQDDRIPLAELRPGERVRVVSLHTRVENGNDIYKIRTEQGWLGWVNSTFLVVEHPGV